VPYRRDETIDRGVTMTRAVLRATVELAKTRDAAAVIVVPQFGPEAENERLLRRRVLDEAGLPYVLVPIDPTWRLRWDRHPNARAANAIAAAIARTISTRPDIVLPCGSGVPCASRPSPPPS
jgi:hypothetical protein